MRETIRYSIDLVCFCHSKVLKLFALWRCLAIGADKYLSGSEISLTNDDLELLTLPIIELIKKFLNIKHLLLADKNFAKARAFEFQT